MYAYYDDKMPVEGLPITGIVYPFYVEGDMRKYNQYAALVTRVIPYKEIKNTPVLYNSDNKVCSFEDMYNKAKEISKSYSDNVDYIIECAIPRFSASLIHFAPTDVHNWLSLPVMPLGITGVLDVNYMKNYDCLSDFVKEQIDNNKLK